MNVKNLPLKFAFIAAVVALCLVSIKTKGLKEGIDLRGGHSLIFEIRTPASEVARLESEKKELLVRQADPAATAAQREEVQKEIKGLDDQIADNNRAQQGVGNLAEDVIGILKKRVDPNGLYSLEWRPVGSSRIEVRMPAGQEESRKFKEAFNRALREAEDHNISRSQIRRLLQSPPAERPKLTREMNVNKLQAQRLNELTATYDRVQTVQSELTPLKENVRQARTRAEKTSTQPSLDPKVKSAQAALDKVQADLINSIADYEAAQLAIENGNINLQEVQNVLRNYVSPQEEAVLKRNNAKELDRRQAAYKDGKESLFTKYKGREADIDRIIAANEEWSGGRKRLDDPSDLVRLIRKAGVLEFRMAPYVQGTGSEYQISNVDRDRYLQQLDREGPDPGHKRNDPYQWFPTHGERESYGPQLVTSDYGGRKYILLSNNPGDSLLNPPGGVNRWTLTDSYPTSDQSNRPAVGFKFDAKGAKLFYQLTSIHKADGSRPGDHMAVLLDDEVYSCPVINAAISDSGIIEGSFTQQEVLDLVSTFKAGSLPAKLNPDPVSVSSFGSALGEINKNMSIKAGIIALAAVAAFMLLYYFLSGAIANIALALNIILILGVMSAFDAVFTMPGIAGLILTIGMAVDSNVLISERLREEQDRGLPIRLAFKNAYDRAFSAIFDSHLTALITCVVLYWVGTEEVKGFALTLGLGVAFNLFTAVFFTKWIVMVMFHVKMIRSHQYMLRLIHVPKIDWMAKRYYFWAFSLITALLGIAALISEGGRIWGIEFSAGTQATVIFKNDGLVSVGGQNVLPNDRNVADLFKEAAQKLAATDSGNKNYTSVRDNSRVETVIDPDRVEKFLKIYDPAYDPNKQDNQITLAQWKAAGGNAEFFRLADTNHDNVLGQAELEKSLPETAYRVNTTETRVPVIAEVARTAFGPALANRQKINYHLAAASDLYAKLGVPSGPEGRTQIKPDFKAKANPDYRNDFEDYEGGLLLVVDNMDPAATRLELEQRLADMRLQPDETLASQATNPVLFVGLTPAEGQKYSSFAILARPADPTMVTSREAWNRFAENEAKLVNEMLHREDSMTATNYDPQVAGQTKQRAIVAIVLSWLAIIAYLWLRFGQASWGLAAVICLIHDSIIVVGMVAVSDWISRTSIGRSLLVGSFKIDLAMIAAVLTIIGYSVSDTIVVFDRIRENRGKLKTVSYNVINASINQTLSRTILTVFTVFIVVFVMYVWGGESIRGFNYALLVGIFFGCYSSIAVAAPILLGFRQMVTTRVGAVTESSPSKSAPPQSPQDGGK